MEPDKIYKTNRKTLALVIDDKGRLIVRAPKQLSNLEIQAFVDQKSSWIREKQQKIAAQNAQVKQKQFTEGEKFLYHGNDYPLSLIKQQNKALIFDGKSFYLRKSDQHKGSQVFENWYRKTAKRDLAERSALYADMQGVAFRSIRITGARTRWGSCGVKGTLNFAWRLVMAPLPVIDYVVLHEITHLTIRNHSKAFWSRLESFMPDYQVHRKWLKANGPKLII